MSILIRVISTSYYTKQLLSLRGLARKSLFLIDTMIYKGQMALV